MKIIKQNYILGIINDYLIDSPAPRNLNYMWNIGSQLGLNLIIMIITGISLAMHYTPNIELAFGSIEHIMRDVNNGWILRYIHANGASLFFIWVYIHIGRGLYYGSYKSPRGILWIIGIIIYFIMMATAFQGYVLPWGQMSYWGACVITNLLGVQPGGEELVYYIWGSWSVDNATLNRFYSLHYQLPFILTALVLLHLLSLHQSASNNPEGITSKSDRIRFHPYYTSKDIIGFMLMFLILSILVYYYPNLLGHPDNNIPANPLVTPHSIVPEWYFQPFYAILRAIPNKTLGVLALFTAILSLILLPQSKNKTRSNRYKPIFNILWIIFIINFIFLIWLGAKPISEPYTSISIISTIYYFSYIIIQIIF